MFDSKRIGIRSGYWWALVLSAMVTSVIHLLDGYHPMTPTDVAAMVLVYLCVVMMIVQILLLVLYMSSKAPDGQEIGHATKDDV